jgi:hypothetical protein
MSRAPSLKVASAVILVGINTSTGTLAAGEKCNPPHKQCGDAPLVYQCPPCPPPGIQMATPVEAEQYRLKLEAYRRNAETLRTADTQHSLAQYQLTIKQYQRGIADYKAVINATEGQAER